MSENLKHGVVAKPSLTEAELADIRALAGACARYEDVDLRIAWSALQSRAGEVAESFLAYRDSALVGFLTLDGVGSDEAEAAGMVHPEYRRQGIFTALVAAAREVCRHNGTPSIVFVCDRRSAAAKAFLVSAGAQYEMSEQKMQLDARDPPPYSDSPLDFHFHRATIADAHTITQIIADDSGMDATYFRQIVVRGIQSGARQFYVANLGAETVGTINIDVIDGEPYIYGFVVRPEYRGRGYGRQMLARTIAEVAAERPGPIFLEVETDNDAALALYRSFGFTTTHVYDYYRMKT